MFQAILFDLDNTLIDFMKMKEESCKAAVKAMIKAGLPLSEKKAFKLLFELYGVHGIEFQRIFQEFLKKVLGRVDYRILAKAITAYRLAEPDYTIPYPSVKPVLRKLMAKGIVLGIVSDAPRMRAWLRLTEMNLSDFFKIVITVGDVKKRKPARLPFRKAFEELKKVNGLKKIKPENVLFVGDNPFKDVKGAKAFGFKTALAKYGCLYPSKKIKADYELKEFKELLEIL